MASESLEGDTVLPATDAEMSRSRDRIEIREDVASDLELRLVRVTIDDLHWSYRSAEERLKGISSHKRRACTHTEHIATRVRHPVRVPSAAVPAKLAHAVVLMIGGSTDSASR